MDKDESNGDRDRYVFFLLIALFFPPQKESNRFLDLDKRIKSLNYLIYIPKNC